jgi:acetyl/propionyl-CoA carboxylase alpha subunit
MIYEVTIGERTLTVEIQGSVVTVDGDPYEVDLGRVADGPIRSLLVDGRSHGFAAHEAGGGGRWRLHFGGLTLSAVVVDERTRSIRAMTGEGRSAKGPRPIVAPMPGKVVRVEVAVGDEVRAGQGIVIVEAMKMENELVADSAGMVSGVHVREGQAVEKDQLLVDLAPLEDGDGT